MENQLTEARAIIARLSAHQKTLGIKDAAMASRFRNGKGNLLLGSERTWQRMRDDDWRDLNPAKWLPNLRECAQQLDGGTPVEEVHRDLAFFRTATAELDRLEGQQNDRRGMLVLGITGVGKTVWSRSMVNDAPGKRTYTRANPSWRERPTNICCAIASVLGAGGDHQHMGFKEALDLATAALQKHPRTVFIDEGHEGGIALMKLVRSWIDSTASRFVVLAYPTEYKKVASATTGAMVEAKQFLGRCIKPILDDWAGGPTVQDVEKFLRHEEGLRNLDATVLAELTALISRHYGLRLLSDAISEASIMAAEADRDPNLGDIITAAYSLAGEQKKPGK